MVCSIDDIVSRRPGKHTRFPTVYLYSSYLLYFFNRLFFSLFLSLSDYYLKKNYILHVTAWVFNFSSLSLIRFYKFRLCILFVLFFMHHDSVTINMYRVARIL